MLFFIISLLMVQNRIIEITSQLILSNADNRTDCSDGLRSGIDVFNFTGSIGPDYNNLVQNDGWQSTVFVRILRSGSGSFNILCPIPVGVNGGSCIQNSTRACYCSNFDLTSQTAYFIINFTAQAINSDAFIRLEWQNANTTIIYSDSKKLPRIYDLPKLELIIRSSKNTLNSSQISENQNIGILHNDNVSLEFNCSETATPCYVNIFANGISNSGTQSVHVNFIFNVTRSDTLKITAEYAVCSRGQLQPFRTFFLQAAEDESSTAVTSTSYSKSPISANEASTAVMATSSSKTTISDENNDPDNHLGLKIGLPVGLGISAIIIFAVGIICYKKKRMNAQRSIEQPAAKQSASDDSSNNDGNKTSSTEKGGNNMGTEEMKSNKAEINKPDNKIKYTKDREQEGKEEIHLNININGNKNDKFQSRPLPAINKSNPTRPPSIEETHGNS